jgi:guanylate kinase
VDGTHYHFLSRDEFESRVARGEFLEWATYGGELYGTLRSEVQAGLASGRHVVLDIEVNGAEQLRARMPGAVHVFVLPPSAAALAQRLRSRGTDGSEAVARRLWIASEELDLAARYDYVIVNDDLVDAVAQVAAILEVESRRVGRIANLADVVHHLREGLADATTRAR